MSSRPRIEDLCEDRERDWNDDCGDAGYDPDRSPDCEDPYCGLIEGDGVNEPRVRYYCEICAEHQRSEAGGGFVDDVEEAERTLTGSGTDSGSGLRGGQ